MNIRQLTTDDVEIFRTLRTAAVHEAPIAFTQSVTEIVQLSDADWADILQSHGKDDFVLGAFDDANQLVGMLGFYRAVHAKQRHKGTFWGMYISPAHRQYGFGNALVSTMIQRIKSLPDKISSITLCVASTNQAAKRLYEANGFQLCGVEQRALYVDDQYVDEELMQLLL
jgi:ribosomal protein S18 acetylase RimI-like enzyme